MLARRVGARSVVARGDHAGLAGDDGDAEGGRGSRGAYLNAEIVAAKGDIAGEECRQLVHSADVVGIDHTRHNDSAARDGRHREADAMQSRGRWR